MAYEINKRLRCGNCGGKRLSGKKNVHFYFKLIKKLHMKAASQIISTFINKKYN